MQAPHAPLQQPAALRVDYRDDALATLLAEPGLLGVFGFGDDAPTSHADPRYLHVALPVHGTAPFECWFGAGPVRHGREDGIAWATDGQLQFGWMEIAEHGHADGSDGSDIESAAARAYERVYAWLARSECPHPLRLWNYMDAITEGDGDAERYRRFCVGRARGIQAAIGRTLAPAELPAATAIGHPRPTGRFQLYWLAAREPGTPVENPRQTQAWRYPRQYGPQAPGFARAMLPPADARMPLLLSGTAAVVGHASRHHDSLAAQLDETLANLHSLIEAARAQRPALETAPGDGARLKVYVRDAASLSDVAALLDARLPPELPRIVLHGAVCRRELAVEIDGVHA
ncbi:MAG: pteridine-dependent deoxygenase [Pseudomonadota bacterium]